MLVIPKNRVLIMQKLIIPPLQHLHPNPTRQLRRLNPILSHLPFKEAVIHKIRHPDPAQRQIQIIRQQILLHHKSAKLPTRLRRNLRKVVPEAFRLERLRKHSAAVRLERDG